ncbi:MAG: MBL fold metallo-hydrolase [Oscillospiraceae bacterium]|nr:MBL fold metallo-hydrolase [Oscillospiraceae bacterium]
MEITWYSAVGLVMREGDAAIAFDPFFGLPVGCFTDKDLVPLPKQDFEDVTDVFVTHGHIDHIYYLPALCGGSQFQIHCTPTPRKTLMGRGIPPERIVPIAAGGTEEVSPFTVTAYQGRHCRFDLPLILEGVLRGKPFRHPIHLIRFLLEMRHFHEEGEILMYEVTCGETRIQVMGSLGLDEHTDYPTDADILILPFQGRSDLETYALGFVRRLKPRMVLLDHHDDAFPPVSDEVNTEDFIRILSEQEHIPCCALVKGRSIHVET